MKNGLQPKILRQFLTIVFSPIAFAYALSEGATLKEFFIGMGVLLNL
ncbi:MAG: hypothetical protein ACREHC_08965 [Candidatus Levyibacteriota bacterium]